MDVDEKKIFVGGLSWETTDEKLKEYFSKYGEVTDSIIMKDSASGRPRGFGFVTFRETQSVMTALQEPKHHLDGKTIDPKRAFNPSAQKKGVPPNPSTQPVKKVFVGGIPAGTTEEDLREHFSGHGTVREVELKYDKQTMRMRGFGFVTFESEEDVTKLCDLQFSTINQKTIEVKKAEPRYHGAAAGPSMTGGGGSYGGGSKNYGQGFNQGYATRSTVGSGSGAGQYAGFSYGYGQSGYGQGGYGQGGFGQGGYSYPPSGAYNPAFSQGSYSGGGYSQQGSFGYSQGYPYQNYDSSGGRPGQQQVSTGGYQQDSAMYSQGSVARGFPSGTDQYAGHTGGTYGTGYGGGSDMPSTGNSYQYSQGSNGEKPSSGFPGGPRGGQQAHPGAQYGTGFSGGR